MPETTSGAAAAATAKLAMSPSPHPAGDLQRQGDIEDGMIQEKPIVSPEKAGLFSRARILGPVTKDHGDLALLACCFVTGMVDAASFMNWGEL